MPNLWEIIKEAFKKKGFRITIKRPWPGEENLPSPRMPWDRDTSDPMDQIVASMNRKYECRGCGKEARSADICRCKICGKFFCKRCYTLIDGKAWCKECLQSRKP